MGDSAPQPLLCVITGQPTIPGALAWIAEGRPYTDTAATEIFNAILEARRDDHPRADEALRHVAKSALDSDVDTAAAPADLDAVLTPADCDRVIEHLVTQSPTRSVLGIGSSTLRSALTAHRRAVEVYAQIAGLSWRELRSRCVDSGVQLPGAPEGPWSPRQLQAVIDIIEAVATGAHDIGPVDLVVHEPSNRAAALHAATAGGVSYGTLLSQRIVGSAWGAHRNRNAWSVRSDVVARLASNMVNSGLAVWATAGPEQVVVSRAFLNELVATDADVGQIELLVRNSDGAPTMAVFVAVANDGGSARKTASTLRSAPGRVTVPAALVLAGQGWAHRSETDPLIHAFSGRVVSDRHLDELTTLALHR